MSPRVTRRETSPHTYERLPVLVSSASTYRIILSDVAEVRRYRPSSQWIARFDLLRSSVDKSFVGTVADSSGYLQNASAVYSSPKLWESDFQHVEKLSRKVADMIPPPQSLRRRRRWSDDDGDEFSPSRLLEGSSPWLQDSRLIAHGPRDVVLASRQVFSASVKSQTIMAAAACTAAFTAVLEAAQYRTRVVGIGPATGVFQTGLPNLCLMTIVKDFGDPSPEYDIAAALQPWFYRGAIFAYHGVEESDLPYGHLGTPVKCPFLGEASNLPSDLVEKITPMISPNGAEIIEFDPSLGGRLSVEDTIESAIATITQFGEKNAR